MTHSFAYRGNDTVGTALTGLLEDAGFVRCSDIASADFILTFYLTPDAIEDAYFESDGIIASAQQNSVLIDLGPTTPTFSRELSAVAAVNDISAVDAPLQILDIMREDAFSDTSNMMVLAGGEEDAFKQALCVLDAIADDVVYCGPSGSGQTAKAMLAIQAAAQIIAAIEADALGRSTLDDAFAQTVHTLTQRASLSTSRIDEIAWAVEHDAFDSAFSASFLLSELATALSAADDIDLILPQTEAALQLLELLCVIGGSDMAPSALSLVYGDEHRSAAHGLDWARAENMYADMDDMDDMDDSYRDESETGFDGPFSGYSIN